MIKSAILLLSIITTITGSAYADSRPQTTTAPSIWQSNELLASTLGFGSTASWTNDRQRSTVSNNQEQGSIVRSCQVAFASFWHRKND